MRDYFPGEGDGEFGVFAGDLFVDKGGDIDGIKSEVDGLGVAVAGDSQVGRLSLMEPQTVISPKKKSGGHGVQSRAGLRRPALRD